MENHIAKNRGTNYTNICFWAVYRPGMLKVASNEKVQVGKDQEKAQSERDSHSKTEVGKNQTNNQALIPLNIS